MSTKNPVLIDIAEEIQTPRLYLRMPKAGDGRFFFEATSETPELSLWMPFAIPVLPGLDDCELICRRNQAEFILRTALRFNVFSLEGRFIGCVAYPRINWSHRMFEIGYWIRSSESGKGYVTEMARALVQYAFDHLEGRRVEIKCNASNLKSRAVPERLGFNLEAISVNADCVASPLIQNRDEAVYAMTNAGVLERTQLRF